MNNPFKDKTNSEIIFLINEYIHSERDRYIAKRKLVDDISHEAISSELDIDPSTVKRAVQRDIMIIKKALQR